MTKRILQIVPTLDCTGAAKQLCLLTEGLPRDQFDVHVCALHGNGPLGAKLSEIGIPWTSIGKRWKLDLGVFQRLKQHVARLQPDLIHAWMFDANTYGFAAAAVGGVKHVVLGQRRVDPWQSWLQRTVDRIMVRRCSCLVVDSQSMRDFYARQGVPSERMRIIPKGVKVPDPPNATRRQLLDELELPEGSRLLGLIGDLRPQNRVKDAIWAADLLKVIRGDIHLLVIGDGPHRDRFRRFRDLCRIRDQVHFLGPRSDVSQMMPHLDVLWSTGGCDAPVDAILDAMAAGVPVVAADVSGARELIVSGQTGLLVPLGDRAGFARYTDRLLNDDALAARLSAAGRQRAQSEFRVDQMVARYAELYGGG